MSELLNVSMFTFILGDTVRQEFLYYLTNGKTLHLGKSFDFIYQQAFTNNCKVSPIIIVDTLDMLEVLQISPFLLGDVSTQKLIMSQTVHYTDSECVINLGQVPGDVYVILYAFF